MAAYFSRRVQVHVLGVLVEGATLQAPFIRSASSLCRPYSRSSNPLFRRTYRHPSSIKPPEHISLSLRHYVSKSESVQPGHIARSPDEVVNAAQELATSQTIPEEEAVYDMLRGAQDLAEALPVKATTSDHGESYSSRQAIIEKLSEAIYELVASPNVFITPRILDAYVSIQSKLSCPETLAPIFELYASKPVAVPKTSPTQYRAQNPKKATAAIPLHIAKTAIDAAADIKNLPICLDIVTKTVSTPAYKRNQWLRRGTLPVTAAVLAPFAAWQIATFYGTYQDMLDPEVARNLTFAGVLTYLGATSTLGYIAVTTSNDQMRRVTWVDGTPLHERWIREDERALLDQVALRWGFNEKSRWGEEEGQDWDALREWVGVRGMILDRVSLMEGME